MEPDQQPGIISGGQPAPANFAADTSGLPADAPWYARWLVAEAKSAWAWASVQWSVACAVAIEAYNQMTPDQQQSLITWSESLVPAQYRPHVLAGAFAVVGLLRVMKFKKPQP